MFATSLGPDDACFVAGANWEKNSGLMCVWGQVCAVQKEVIEAGQKPKFPRNTPFAAKRAPVLRLQKIRQMPKE